MFSPIKAGPPDPMYDLKKRADGDTSERKVDLGVGIYRNEEGLYQEPQCIKEAKNQLSANDPGHDYEITTGNADFLEAAARVMFGQDCARLASNEIASVQTISGTGAVHLAALLIAQCLDPKTLVYVGVPTWGNYKPLFELTGLQAVEYNYYDTAKRSIDFQSILRTVQVAPPQSVFILQGCCHNPTGADLTADQWKELALALRECNHLPLFDVAYQGLGNGLDEDAYAVRLFASMNFEMFVCQSFSKNFALYGERCGALHALCADTATTLRVYDRLRCLIRWEFSSSPAFGSRLVNIVLQSETMTQIWYSEMTDMRERLKALRQSLFELLVHKFKTPGYWGNIVKETGLFSYLPLSPAQCSTLVDQHHVYLPPNGRINISGLSQGNLESVARAIDSVVRSPKGVLAPKLA